MNNNFFYNVNNLFYVEKINFLKKKCNLDFFSGGQIILAFEASEHHHTARNLPRRTEPVSNHGVCKRWTTQPDSQFGQKD